MENTLLAEPTLTRGLSSAVKRTHFESFGASPAHNAFPVHRAFLGLLIFLATEIMFFAGLISAFLILRASSEAWPPPHQPRLPVAVTGVNTLFLIASAFTMHFALRAIRVNNIKALTRRLMATAALGIIFLAVQGYEWLRLVQYGLTFNSSIYGGTFYALIGAHGLHVLAAVLVLLFTLRRSFESRYSGEQHHGIELCSMYWVFVVAIWPVLYVLVYWN